MYNFDCDEAFVVHVSKSGNDGNTGIAGQYPVDLSADAKLTIGSALGVVNDGGTILIWPGTYDEQVDIATATKSIKLLGIHKHLCKIAQAGANKTVLLYKDCILQNLIIEQTGTTRAVDGEARHNGQILDCDIISDGTNAVFFPYARNVYIKHCFMKCKLDTLIVYNDFLIEDSVIVATGLDTDPGDIHALMGIDTVGRGIIRNSSIIAQPSYGKAAGKGAELYESDRDLYGIYSLEILSLDNCNVIADGYKPIGAHADSYSDGDAYAVIDVTNLQARNCTFKAYTDQSKNKTAYGIKPDMRIALENCIFDTLGQAATYDLYAASAKIAKLLNCYYDSTKVHANVTVHAIGDSNGRVDVSRIEGSDATDQINAACDVAIADAALDKAAKILKNKAIQNKATGVIEYYDDDGETIILTHTPADGESEITRTPS